MLARYDAQNPAALRRLIAAGTQLRAFPRPVMDAAFKAAQELYAETAAKNEGFKKMHDHYMAFRDDQILWARVCEKNFDDFMIAATTARPAPAKGPVKKG